MVEAFGQCSCFSSSWYRSKRICKQPVYLMSVDKARFRSPIIPDCELHLEIEAVRSHEGFGNTKAQQKLMEKEWRMLSGQQR